MYLLSISVSSSPVLKNIGGIAALCRNHLPLPRLQSKCHEQPVPKGRRIGRIWSTLIDNPIAEEKGGDEVQIGSRRPSESAIYCFCRERRTYVVNRRARLCRQRREVTTDGRMSK